MLDSGGVPRTGDTSMNEALPVETEEGFAHAVATLAAGELMFPWPFDLATSAALMRNVDMGGIDAVRRLFDSSQPGSQFKILVSIHQVVPEVDGLPMREVIDTVADPDATVVLLAGFIHELLQRRVE